MRLGFFKSRSFYFDPNILASLLCQRSAQAARLPLCSPQLGAPSLPFLPDTPHCPVGVGRPSRSAELLGDWKAEGTALRRLGTVTVTVHNHGQQASASQRAGRGDEQGLPGPAHRGGGCPAPWVLPLVPPTWGSVPGFPGPWSVRHSCVPSVPRERPVASVARFGISVAVVR